MVTASELITKKGRHLETGLDETQIKEYLGAVEGWSLQEGKLVRSFEFANYHETLAFVNAVAWPVHADDHHPELTVTYNRCVVKFDTHSVNGGRGGISENDFILAAKVDAIYRQKTR
ncbi:MAG TPA: 4a-hydroxytetrahydrobiopterin dehydratase [Noviherbaspirillum sp.]|jgi:4a-hydroxytetrahydrobiopterin dehydratase|uniref:4a-hydroxytetrahydrobiopterin dehydratase n=1 Tax=Noviherbaspirillum sp. TaxID=1926288 RepID=UPI002F921730